MHNAEYQLRCLDEIRYASHVQRVQMQTQMPRKSPEVFKKQHVSKNSSAVASEWLDVLYVLGVPNGTGDTESVSRAPWALHVGKPLDERVSKLSDVILMIASPKRVEPEFFLATTTKTEICGLLDKCHIPWKNAQAINSHMPNFVTPLPDRLQMRVMGLTKEDGAFVDANGQILQNVRFKVQVDQKDFASVEDDVAQIRKTLFEFFVNRGIFKEKLNNRVLERPRDFDAQNIHFYADIKAEDTGIRSEEEQS